SSTSSNSSPKRRKLPRARSAAVVMGDEADAMVSVDAVGVMEKVADAVHVGTRLPVSSVKVLAATLALPAATLAPASNTARTLRPANAVLAASGNRARRSNRTSDRIVLC